jgi:hypothetical protein
MHAGRHVNVQLVQHRKNGEPFGAPLFASPLDVGKGECSAIASPTWMSVSASGRAVSPAASKRAGGESAGQDGRAEAANSVLEGLVQAGEKALLAEASHRAKNRLTSICRFFGCKGGGMLAAPADPVRGIF